MAMRFEHEFTVPVPVEQAWPVLLDVERVGPCLPGATVDEVEDDSFTGRMKVKVGPITVTYQGRASFEKVDEDTHSMTIKASGKEARGSGTAGATVVARLHPEGRNTRVTVDTSFNVTGRPAQFGRGVMSEVGEKLIDRFAANLSLLLGEGPTVETAAEAPSGTPGVGGWSAPSQPGPADEVPVVSAASGPGPATPAGQEELSGAGAGPTSGASGRHLSAVPTPPGLVVDEKSGSRQSHPAGTSRTSLSPDEEAMNLLEVAGLPLLKRAAPLLVALVGLALTAWLIRRTLRRKRQ
ncbi:SRPBCC family protein [Streptosporangium sp. NBC_01755]|uniref:SRPBCC family protein n=1 Tax=unclassified Streptosporangium TaxID=2632669 RepID=UPI002DDBA219|nr:MULTISPECIES: SRPBCC family protein [unclassified Streptosporangium]WSA24332.1 SRPBCC family protein [Streptosporangium sp. NBC_01810]WSC97594.1 SRPBCC family protein [Streptosporangium sp. NBC_01755]